MNREPHTPMSRRTLLGDLARGVVALAAGGGILALAARRGGRCRVPDLCADCPSLRACSLPAALLARAERGKQ